MQAMYQSFSSTYQNDARWIKPDTLAECCIMTNVAIRKNTLEKIETYERTFIQALKETGAPQAELKKWTDISEVIHALATSDDSPPPKNDGFISSALKSHGEMLSRQSLDQIQERDRFLWNHLDTANRCLQMMIIKRALLASFDEMVADAHKIEPLRFLRINEITAAKASSGVEARNALLQNIITINTTLSIRDNTFPLITSKLIEWARRLKSCNNADSIVEFASALRPMQNAKQWCEDKLKEKREKMVESFANFSCSPIDDKFRYYLSLQSQIAGLEACMEGIRESTLSR